MKYLISLLFLMAGTMTQEYDLAEVRKLYNRAANEEKAAEELLESLEKSEIDDPVFFGYKGAAHMMMAKHVGNPFKKMSHFNKGKDIFDNAIAADKQSLELRFLRFAVQAEAPGFLGYRDNLEEDKIMLITGVREIKDTVLQKTILKYLRTSKGLSAAEKKALE